MRLDIKTEVNCLSTLFSLQNFRRLGQLLSIDLLEEKRKEIVRKIVQAEIRDLQEKKIVEPVQSAAVTAEIETDPETTKDLNENSSFEEKEDGQNVSNSVSIEIEDGDEDDVDVDDVQVTQEFEAEIHQLDISKDEISTQNPILEEETGKS